MSNPAAAVTLPRHMVLGDVIPGARTRDVALVIGGALLTALLAQVAIDVPPSPVPITGQTLAVGLVGATLGMRRGAAALALYALLGLFLPFYSEGESGWDVVYGASGGYIIGFIFAAAFTGWLAQRQWDRKVLRSVLAFLGGSVIVFAIGLPWLAVALGALGAPNDLNSVLQAGLYPFIIGGIVKSLLATGIMAIAWRAIARSDAKRAASDTANPA